MPVYAPSTRSLTPSTDATGDRQGRVPGWHGFRPSQGIPRFEDLLSIRVLERQPTISLPMNTIRDQVTTTNWDIRATVDSPTVDHEQAVDELIEWFDGGFNPNEQKFAHFLKLVVTDSLSVDTGSVELVPTEPDSSGYHWLAEMWHLDGITIAKELDGHGRIPDPPDPAYYQFSPQQALDASVSWGDVIERLASQRSMDILRSYGRRRHPPVAFSRDEVVLLERNPQPATNYGFGLVQQAKHWAEILLNVDISNATYFSDNEVPQGILRVNAGSRKELDRARDYFRDTIRGQTDHIVPTLDGRTSEDLDWIPIQGTPEELQFLDSQQWYHKLVWYLFGLNQGEIGDSGDVNRSTASEHSRQVFRQTTKPLMDDLAEMFNTDVLPAHEAYNRVNGEVEFYFEIEHEQMEALERERQKSDLDNMLTTPNAVLRARGEDELPWGDVPVQVARELSRKHPEWALEHWGGVPSDDIPEESPFGDLDVLGNPPKTRTAADADYGADETGDDSTQGDSGNWNAATAEADGSIEDEYPDIADVARNLTSRTDHIIEDELARAADAIEDIWPEDGGDGSLVVDLDPIVDDIAVRDELTEEVVTHSADVMESSAEEEAERLEDELENRYGLVEEVAEISLDFDLTDTVAFELMRRRAARDMVSVEETVRDRIRNTLIGLADDGTDVSEVTEVLDEEIPEISRGRSRTIARTELPQASREGSQALAESTDVVGGKDWIPTNDGNDRPWHAAMSDHEPIPVDESWTVPSGWQGKPHYQPGDYPRAAFTVGEDQPFNCRCVQRSVLAEDMPDDARALDDWHGVTVEMHVTDRQFEVWCEHARDGEGFETMLSRLDQERSRTKLAEELCNGSKKQLYQWLDDCGLK